MCPDTQRSATTSCQYPGCSRPVWRDPDGSYSSFCGNAHRLAMASHPRSQSRMCKVGQYIHVIRHITNSEVKELRCQARVHREWAGYAFGQCSQKTTHLSLAHDFCGRRCAGAFNSNDQRPSHSRSSLPPNDNMCIIPECRNRAYVEDNGNATQFCSHRHRRYVPLSGCYPRSWLMSHGTFSAAVQRGMVDACLSCVLKLRETCQTWRLVHGSHKVARKCQRLRSVTSKATSVLGIAARPRSVEVSYSLPEVPSLRFIVVLI